MKCNFCKTLKKADNCQKCFSKMHQDYWEFLNIIQEQTNIIHISSLDKIKNLIKTKREEIRNNFTDLHLSGG